MTPAEHAVAVQTLIGQLAPVVSEASRTVPHTVVLAALLGMFRSTALHCPCCMETAASACMSVGIELGIHHAKQLAPSGESIH